MVYIIILLNLFAFIYVTVVDDVRRDRLLLEYLLHFLSISPALQPGRIGIHGHFRKAQFRVYLPLD